MGEQKITKSISEVITITQEEYDYMLSRIAFLNCLEACGVDNWDGYGMAYEMFEEEEEEE